MRRVSLERRHSHFILRGVQLHVVYVLWYATSVGEAQYLLERPIARLVQEAVTIRHSMFVYRALSVELADSFVHLCTRVY